MYSSRYGDGMQYFYHAAATSKTYCISIVIEMSNVESQCMTVTNSTQSFNTHDAGVATAGVAGRIVRVCASSKAPRAGRARGCLSTGKSSTMDATVVDTADSL